MGNSYFSYLSEDQRKNAIQRLTALWAFCESGLGGVMHALQIPFTGLIIGGMAILIITLIGQFSKHKYKQIFTSLFIVLIVKAMISPHTPFTAYIAVTFQALMAYIAFNLLHINFFSILLLSLVTMLESAIQKLLILTLFFGKSFWKAADAMTYYITDQPVKMNISSSNWIIGGYLMIYIAGGIFIALITYKIIKGFYINNKTIHKIPIYKKGELLTDRHKSKKRLLAIILVLFILSIVLFITAKDTAEAWLIVLKTICRTVSIIVIWYMIITPLLTKFLNRILQKKKTRYSEEILSIVSFLPVLKHLAAKAWQSSTIYKGLNRWGIFLFTLIHWALVYAEYAADDNPVNTKAKC